MGSRRWLLFISGILLQLFVLTISEEIKPIQTYCTYGPYQGTYTSNSTFGRNLDSVYRSAFFTSNATFYNFSIGEVNVIALCRGDIGLDTCRRCLNETNSILREHCTKNKESITWKENCMFWYSDRAIFNTINTFPNVSAKNDYLAPDANQFNKAVRTLLDKLRGQAARGSSVMKFATGNMSFTNNLTIYGLVQCTPDLTAQQCSDCLNGATEALPQCCDGRIGGRELRPSCNFRYETHKFYLGTAADIPSQSYAPSGNGDSKILIIIIATVIPTIIFAILVCIFIIRRNRKQYDVLAKMSSEETLQYDFNTIKVATKHFSDSNKLGQGGFGAVYKGSLSDGQEIAVKRLAKNSTQGEKEFKTEVSVLAKLQHRNLVRLLGCSLKDTERLLIYEFVPNGSLDNFIFDQVKRPNLDAGTRYKIITGVARGILYFHRDSRDLIIHRDIKAGNILLDADMNPKIADFGLAKLVKQEEAQDATSKIAGTRGYMAPEYEMGGHLSHKLDVFSFGVLVLEIVSGQKNKFQNGENLRSKVWKNWRDGKVSDVIDPMLRQGAGSIDNMTRCIHIALLCVQKDAADRPTMDSVIHMLGDSLTPREPSELASPKDFYNTSEQSEQKSENGPAQMSQNEVSITELSAR